MTFRPQGRLNVLQAVEQYEALRAKEAEQVAELDTAREEAKAALAAFNDLSTRRYDLFMAAFDHVAAHIDPIFKVRPQGLGLVSSTALQLAVLLSLLVLLMFTCQSLDAHNCNCEHDL